MVPIDSGAPTLLPDGPLANLVAVTRDSVRTPGEHAVAPILPGLTLKTLVVGGLRAHVVPLPACAKTVLDTALADPVRTRELVLAHARIVDALGQDGPVVPFRLPSLVAGDPAVLDLLHEHRDDLEACLDRVEGCAEWGLRVVLEQSAPAPVDDPTAASGADFLRIRLRSREQRQLSATTRAEAVASLHARLAGCARLADRPEVDSRPVPGGRCLLRASFLVESHAADRFAWLVDTLAAEVAQHGLLLALSGPFPPYSFVQDALEARRAAA